MHEWVDFNYTKSIYKSQVWSITSTKQCIKCKLIEIKSESIDYTGNDYTGNDYTDYFSENLIYLQHRIHNAANLTCEEYIIKQIIE